MHKSGFVNIIGKPNAGKSTLMNALTGEKLSIITSKAQTTRHRIFGIVNGEDFQIVFSDTPGIVKPGYKLHDSMMKFVHSALVDADIILYVADIAEPVEANPILDKVNNTTTPMLLALNKVDTVEQAVVMEKIAQWQALLPHAEVILISALVGLGVEGMLERIISLLPQGEPYYDKDALTDRPERFFVSEIIREKIFLNYKQEIPYSCEVEIEEYKEEPTITRIRAVIVAARETQKGILIGHKGSSLKKVGTQARIDIEKFLDQKVFLELYVKIKPDWRNDERFLKQHGYEL
jgi:GTP-binding protein Era